MSLKSSPSSHPTTNLTNPVVKDSNLQIFLGGSCNPTTWRQNVAIPYLEMNGISYYNPQVDNWTPEVVNSERYAKQNAKILLFVIDKQTRSTVSLVESAFMAGENKSVVLVIYPFDYNVFSHVDSSQQTSKYMETTSKIVKTRHLVNRNLNDSSSFVKSSSLKQSSSTLLSGSSSSTSETNSTNRSASSTLTSAGEFNLDCCKVDHRIIESNYEETMHVKLSNEAISMEEFHELKQARHILQSLISMKEIPLFTDILEALKYISYCLNGDIDEVHRKSKLLNKVNENSISLDLPDSNQSTLNTTNSNQKSPPTNHQDDKIKDVYLSLDGDDRTSIESSVISVLQEMGLTYNYMPYDSINQSSFSKTKSITVSKLPVDSQISTTSTDIKYSSVSELSKNTKLAIEKEICAIRSSRVLLFVITNKCRGLSIMVLASHFMALFRNNVVLCVQYLEEPCSIGGEILTKTAIADYNRGRVYLCDYAMKSQVPVFNTIGEAIECCNQKCRHKNKS